MLDRTFYGCSCKGTREMRRHITCVCEVTIVGNSLILICICLFGGKQLRHFHMIYVSNRFSITGFCTVTVFGYEIRLSLGLNQT